MLAESQVKMVKDGQALKISQDQLDALATLAQAGDAKAREILAISHAPLCAKRACVWGFDAQEVFAIALVGVAMAINTYDRDARASFTSWVDLKIRGEISCWIRTKNVVTVPDNRRLALLRKEKHARQNGLNLIDLLDNDEAYDYECLKGNFASTSSPLGDGKGTLEDLIPMPDEEGLGRDDLECVMRLLGQLSPEDQAITMGVIKDGTQATAKKLGIHRNALSRKFKANIAKLNRLSEVVL